MREVGFVGGWRGQIKWTFKAEARCLKGPSSSLSRIAGIKRNSPLAPCEYVSPDLKILK